MTISDRNTMPHKRRVVCRAKFKFADDRNVISITVWRGNESKGVEIIDERHITGFEQRSIMPALAVLNSRLWTDIAPVTIDEVLMSLSECSE